MIFPCFNEYEMGGEGYLKFWKIEKYWSLGVVNMK